METETSDQKNIVFLRKREKMEALRTGEYYEFYNQSFQLVGKIVDFPDSGPLTEMNDSESDDQRNLTFGQLSLADCYFEPSLKSELGRLESNELIVCRRNFSENANNLTGFFKLGSDSKSSLKTEEERGEASKSLEECGYLLKGLTSLVAAFLFVSMGGWWWIPTIAASCYSLNCFRET